MKFLFNLMILLMSFNIFADDFNCSDSEKHVKSAVEDFEYLEKEIKGWNYSIIYISEKRGCELLKNKKKELEEASGITSKEMVVAIKIEFDCGEKELAEELSKSYDSMFEAIHVVDNRIEMVVEDLLCTGIF